MAEAAWCDFLQNLVYWALYTKETRNKKKHPKKTQENQPKPQPKIRTPRPSIASEFCCVFRWAPVYWFITSPVYHRRGPGKPDISQQGCHCFCQTRWRQCQFSCWTPWEQGWGSSALNWQRRWASPLKLLLLRDLIHKFHNSISLPPTSSQSHQVILAHTKL